MSFTCIQASNDQATLDIMLPLSFTLAMLLYSGTLGVLVVTTIVTWPIIFVILPLAWVYLQYQVSIYSSLPSIIRSSFLYTSVVDVIAKKSKFCADILHQFVKRAYQA